MSDRARNRGRRLRDRVGRPTQIHEEVWAQIHDAVWEIVEDIQPTMATVTGRDGGKVRVRDDGEDVDYVVGFPRNKGVRHQNGDRVLTMPTRSGERAIVANLTTAQGAAGQAVGDEELFDDGITGKKIRRNELNGDHLQAGAVDRNHVRNNSIGKDQLDGGTVERRHLTANAVGSTELESGAVDRTHIRNNAVGSSQIEGNSVDANHLRSNSVGSSQLQGNSVDSNHIRNGAVGSSQIDDAVLNDLATKDDLDGFAKKNDIPDDLTKEFERLKKDVTKLERRVKRLE